MTRRATRKLGFALALGMAVVAPPALKAQSLKATANYYGLPGLLDMPGGQPFADATLATTLGHFAGTTRGTFAFQLSPRFTGTFRYTQSYGLNLGGYHTYYDRSFDLRYQIAFEGRYRPALAVGLQDFGGTGIYSAEYLVASKNFGERFRVTGGIGWGRLGSFGSFANPLGALSPAFNTRPATGVVTGGAINFGQFFRGPAALFGGIEYQATPRLRLMAEYSSDANTLETGAGQYARRSPLNFGLAYQWRPNVQIGASYMYGSVIGAQVSLAFDPRVGAQPGAFEGAPISVYRRERSTAGEAAFGRILNAPVHGGSAALAVAVSETQTGIRIGRAAGETCAPAAALAGAAVAGGADLVIIGPESAALCTVILTETGRAYVDDRLAALNRFETDWIAQDDATPILLTNMRTMLGGEGFIFEGLGVTATRAELRVRNRTYRTPAQAAGRIARVMTRIMPTSVETFAITFVDNGVPISTITLRRRDLEDLEHGNEAAWTSYAQAQITGLSPQAGEVWIDPDLYPRRTWAVTPYIKPSFFDPNMPFRAEVGVRARGRFEISPGFYVAGSVAQRAIGNIHTSPRLSNSVLPRVRTDSILYSRAGGTALENLYAAYLFRPGENWYGRVSAGYFEQVFGGVSAELLWKPVDSRLALGLEVNALKQRGYETAFAFRRYGVISGHASLYYAFDNGFHAQVDAGRYLAGDWGATFALDREFNNGWKVGGFFTLTNVPFATFGEGSFDKGIRLSIPMAWFTGKPSSAVTDQVIRPITRDGGARVNVPDRLYGQVRGYHARAYQDTWGRFWR